MLKKFFLIGWLCLALGAVPLMAQFGQMHGTVKGDDGQPLANAVISIDREDIRGHYEVKTDKNGKFFHAGLPYGTYSVSVMRDGEKFFTLGGFQTRGSEAAMVEIDLQQERMRVEAAAQGVEIPEEQGGKLTQEQMEALQKAAKEREEQIKKRQELMGQYGSGMAAMEAKDYDAAITAFEAAVAVDPTQDVLLAQIGEAYRAKASQAKTAEEKKAFFDKSLVAYQKSLELKPTDASYHNNFALALASAGKGEEAKAELRKAAQLDPPNAGRYYFNLGALLVNTGQSQAAADAFRLATEADPKSADAYFQLGVTLTGLASVDSSTGKVVPVPGTVEALQKYVELAPNGPNAAAAKSLLETMGGEVTTSLDLSKQKKQ